MSQRKEEDVADVYGSIQMLLEMNTDLHGKVESLTKRIEELENKSALRRDRYLLKDLPSNKHADQFAVKLQYRHARCETEVLPGI